MANKQFFSTNQVLEGLREFAGIELSHERLRQFRAGGTHRRTRIAHTYEKPYEAQLVEGEHWEKVEGLAQYTTAGVRWLFERYGVKVTDEIKRSLKEFPKIKPREIPVKKARQRK